MPIRDRSRRRLVRLGVIRLGHREKRKSNGREYEFPVQDDHFVLTDAPEVAEFYAAQGIDEVRELDVLLPFPDIERNFDAWYQVWAGGVLVCQGDGEYVQYAVPFTCSVSSKGNTSVRNAPGDTLISNGVARVPFDWNDTHFEAGEYVPCPGAAQDLYPHCAACRLNALLKVMMADPALFRMGYYQISTGSGRNYDTIMGTLEQMPADRLNGFPFKLRLVEEQTTYQDTDGQRKKTNKWFLQLEPDPTITRELYRRRVSQMLGAGEVEETPALPESVDPDWEPFDADEPAPPPYAEVQQPGDSVTVEPPEAPEPAETPAEPHTWTKPEANKLFAWTRNDLVITDAQALEALGVPKISDYPGDYEAAEKAINTYISEQAA